MPQLVQIHVECVLVVACYGRILGVHMNEHTPLNNVMQIVETSATLYIQHSLIAPFPINLPSTMFIYSIDFGNG
jgi:hypothetical protein